MLLFKYLDLLPPIPEELLVDPIPDYKPDNIGYKDGGTNWYDATYTRWGTTPKLVGWLQSNISNSVDIAGIQIMSWATHVPAGKRKVNPHCDKRRWALNYVYEIGGPNVTTTLYRERGHDLIRQSGCRLTHFDALVPIESVVVEPRRWHILNTNVLHGVTNVETTRKAVTIGINIDNPLEVIKGYENISAH
jgi:hypothetical protein